MENQEKEKCATGGCCCGKALLAFLLFAMGGIVGYLVSQHCCQKRMSCCMTAPAMEHAMPAAAMPKGK